MGYTGCKKTGNKQVMWKEEKTSMLKFLIGIALLLVLVWRLVVNVKGKRYDSREFDWDVYGIYTVLFALILGILPRMRIVTLCVAYLCGLAVFKGWLIGRLKKGRSTGCSENLA